MKIKIMCSHCSSEEILRDAWASWNEEAQKWVLNNTFDTFFCEACEDETSILEVAIN